MEGHIVEIKHREEVLGLHEVGFCERLDTEHLGRQMAIFLKEGFFEQLLKLFDDGIVVVDDFLLIYCDFGD